MKVLYERPKCLRDVNTHYCAGCGHGIIHRMLAEVVDELGIREKLIGIAPVGCSVLTYDYLDFDIVECAHGRAPAVATGLKRSRPDCIVYSYQGDGDLASIGTAEIIHCANRGENISVFFVNNGIYAMTQGQMAPTTVVGQWSTTSPRGRDPANEGYPLQVCELLATLRAPAYLERVALSTPARVRRARKAILKAFQTQIDGRGFSLVEFLSPCPTYWRMTPQEAVQRIEEDLLPIFPLGTFRDWEEPS